MDIPLKPRTLGEEFALVVQLSLRYGVPLFVLFFAVSVPDLLGYLAGDAGGPWGLLVLLAAPLAAGYSTARIAGAFAHRKIAARDALRVAFRSYWSLLVWQFLVFLVSSVGLLLLVIPGLMWFSLYSLAGPDIVVEQNGLGRALNRAGNLFRGARFRVTVLVSTWFVLKALLTYGVLFMAREADPSSIPYWQVTFYVVDALTLVPLMIAPVVAYYSRRCETESLDLRDLATLVEAIGEKRVRGRRRTRRGTP